MFNLVLCNLPSTLTTMTSYIKDNHRLWDRELSKLSFVHEATGMRIAFLECWQGIERAGEGQGCNKLEIKILSTNADLTTFSTNEIEIDEI